MSNSKRANVSGLTPAQRSAETKARNKAGYDNLTGAQKAAFTRQRNAQRAARVKRVNVAFPNKPKQPKQVGRDAKQPSVPPAKAAPTKKPQVPKR